MEQSNNLNIPEDVSFTMTCPVFKLNFNTADMSILAGMYLISHENYKELVDEYADMKDVNPNTILFFNQRHLIEVFRIVVGMLASVNGYTFDIYKFIKMFYVEASGNCIMINNLYGFIDTWAKSDMEQQKVQSNIIEAAKYLLKRIWFIPYDKIDHLGRLAVDEFNSAKKE